MIKQTSLFLGRCLALAAMALLAPACLLKPHEERTPAGWRVDWQEQGTLTTGRHTKLQLYELFDAAMFRAIGECAAKVNLPWKYVVGKIHSNDATYTLVDNFFFPIVGGVPAVDAPTAIYASGETLNRVEVYVAFYSKMGPALPPIPPDGPQWAQHVSTTYPGQVYWGAEVDGDQYPALGYELHWQFTTNP